ncbi:hypothetical protein GOP47_0010036 [Adiantum capillus-veneris]|uniref:Uncharacterized protein n=1 Tax=Adiantum capillus-veneris TaxID=13818 RepID=A0A9D4UUP4_ADICA|nr:hypothetical protein GOP47_0010036 [Adiantum capillus-veneris]
MTTTSQVEMMQLFDAFMQQQVTYEKFRLDQEEFLRGLAQRDEVVEEALDKASSERGLFDGYDSDGYLACYRYRSLSISMQIIGLNLKNHLYKWVTGT